MIVVIPVFKDIELYEDNFNSIPNDIKVYVKVDDAAYKQNPAKLLAYITKRVQNEYRDNLAREQTRVPRQDS